ncbi:MAG TPA: hypothetical protein VLV54_12745, partial [Thermoanaerobaculia bacterium]|nr:hypothetical protein [Thermoanaerobaculia bacterium]
MKNQLASFRGAATLFAVAGILMVLIAAPASAQTAPGKGAKPTVEDARKFLADASARLFDLTVESGRATWVQETFITYDTEILAA